VAGFANYTELYDAQTGSWAPGPSLIQKRAYHTATPMGNHTVLVAGGFNGKNEKENQGYLQTAEIYNPVSDSITPANPMQERRLSHTATLLPSGEVSVYGGLGSITTSYANPLLNAQTGSSISVRTVVDTTGTVDSDSVFNLLFDANLAVKANGVIADGDVYFSKPRAIISDGDVRFTSNILPSLGTKASLNGKVVRNGEIRNAALTLTAPGGLIITSPQEAASNPVLLTAGSLTINPDPLAAQKSGAVTNGTLSGTINVAMPSYYVDTRRGYGRILSGSASIVYGGGTITQSPSDATLGFSIALDSGTASITNGQIRPDGNGGAYLSMAVTFTGIEGRITNSTETNITSLDLGDMSNLNLLNLNLRLRYVVDYIHMKDFQFQFDIATVTIRRMVFSDEEIFSPKDNAWTLGTPGATLFDQAAVLRQDSVVAQYGGRTCATDGAHGRAQPRARSLPST
ncbi:MAG: kelch repeat-containing protein, partial [Chloroflexota bacterium]